MVSLPNVVRPCINEAVARAPRMLERAVDHAAAALDQAAATRENGWRDWQEAARELRAGRAAWSEAFAAVLRRTLEHPPGSGGPRLHPSSLTLVEDDVVLQSIESSRLAQFVAGPVEQELAELDALMSAALGLDGIQPEGNPLRIELFTSALRNVLGEGAPAGRTAVWMRHMGPPVAEDLLHVYRAAVKLLRRAGVQAAGYRVLTGAAPLARDSQPLPAHRPSRPGGLPFGPSGAAPVGAGHPAAGQPGIGGWLGRAIQALGGPLLRDFINGTGTARLAAQRELDSNWYEDVAEELEALEAAEDESPPPRELLRQHAHLPPVERPVREVGTATALQEDEWGRYAAPRQRSIARVRAKKQARAVGQVVGVEVVRQLLDEVARDPRLLAPVREAMVALEPALARMALHAPRFFGQQEHPARQLIEAVAERSLQFNDEFDDGFVAFLEPVRACFRDLNTAEAEDAEVQFSEVLEQLQACWSREDEEAARRQEPAVRAVRFAEQRQAEAGRIAWDLSQRSDLAGAPELVQDFLFGPWSLVLAQARLSTPAGQVDPGGYLAAISDLLWSAKRDATLADPARAFDLIPRVVAKLRQGLQMIGQPEEDNASFFAGLEQLHRPVLKLRARHRRQALPAGPEPSPATLDKLAPAPPQKPRSNPETVWLAPREVHALGFEDAPVSAAAPLAGGAEQADPVIDGIAEGHWVDLMTRGHWRRARLAWSNSQRSLFMFVGEDGDPHSMTRRSLQRLVLQQHVRPVDAQPVVQRALDALALPLPQALAA